MNVFAATRSAPSSAHTANVDAGELEKFAALAHHWWDPESTMFGPLHRMNPLRLDWIDRMCGGLPGKQVIDVGCGGGILTESMAVRGATALGIDLGEKALGVARLHKLESGVAVDYRLVSAETLAEETPDAFDVVACMELLEHVPEPDRIIAACAKLVKPGGHVIISTINRGVKAYALVVVAAEYVLGLLPKGTHDYAKFLTPAQVATFARRAGLPPAGVTGIAYNPFARTFRLVDDVDVNYMMAFRRPANA